MTCFSNPWQFFEKIYCISITKRADRRAAVEKEFTSVGLLPLVEFVLVDKHPDNPEKGIFNSHMQCLQRGLQAGAKTILVFEDDVCFQGFDAEKLRQATTFLTETPSWNGFFLGAITGSITKTETPVVSQINYRCLAHAYTLNHHFAEKIITKSWQDIPFDNLLQNQCRHFFSITPMIAFQSNAATDNNTFFIDKTRRFFGGLKWLQKFNEFYQHHKTILLSSHLFFFFLLLILAWKYLHNR